MGIDCSSTTIGVSILKINSKNEVTFVECEYIKPIKNDDITLRLADTRDKLSKIINRYKPDHIGIEEIIAYMPRRSSANTVIILAVFNRMACLLSYDYLKAPPKLFNVMSIRHGLKLNNIVPQKEDMPDLVSQHLKIKFPWRYNKKNNAIVENYDMADSVAVALFYSYILTGKCKLPVTKTEKKAKAKSKKKTKAKKK